MRLEPGGGQGRLLPAMLTGGDIRAVHGVEARRAASVPLMAVSAVCGFPSPADDYLDKVLDFNELLGANLPSIFCVNLAGDSMAPLLLPGDLCVIDRALTPADQAIILACLDGEFTIKRYRIKAARCWLQPENPRYPPICLSEGSAFEVWGVVWWSLRRF